MCFVARLPSHREHLWATLVNNCGRGLISERSQIADLKIFYKAIDPVESCIDYRSDLVCIGNIVTEQTLPVTTENEANLQTTEGYGMCASLCIGTPGAISFNWVLKGSSGKCTCLRKVFVER